MMKQSPTVPTRLPNKHGSSIPLTTSRPGAIRNASELAKLTMLNVGLFEKITQNLSHDSTGIHLTPD